MRFNIDLYKQLVLYALLALAFSTVHAAGPHLSLVTAALPPLGSTPEQQGFLERIAHEAFARIGYSVEVHSLPGERALLNVNSGIDDCDLYRAPGFESAYPNLIRVPEKIGVMEFMAYTKDVELKDPAWQSLEPYVVAYANGWKIYERMVKAKEVTVVRSINELFPLLNSGRADLVLLDRWQGLYVAHQQGIGVKLIEPPLAHVDMYMYLHKRHENISPKLVKVLREMKIDGTYTKIYDSVFESLGK